MTFSELISRALHYVSVPKCLACNERLDYEHLALCPSCSARLARYKERNCSRCAKPLYECTCTTAYLEAHCVRKLVKVWRYRQHEESASANAIIYNLKKECRYDALKRATEELATAIRNSLSPDNSYIFSNIPRRFTAVLDYGIDHAAELSRSLAREFGCQYVSLLKSKSKKPQKKLEREERLSNAAFNLKSTPDLKGKTVILIDDIVTTGASMGHCAMLIRSLGAKEIVGAALAIAYFDD